MSITSTQVRDSNFRPLKAGHEFVEVAVKESEEQEDGFITPAIPLGKSYRRIKPVSVVAFPTTNPTTYAAYSASASVVDTANVRLLYSVAGAAEIVATLECEV